MVTPPEKVESDPISFRLTEKVESDPISADQFDELKKARAAQPDDKEARSKSQRQAGRRRPAQPF